MYLFFPEGYISLKDYFTIKQLQNSLCAHGCTYTHMQAYSPTDCVYVSEPRQSDCTEWHASLHGLVAFILHKKCLLKLTFARKANASVLSVWPEALVRDRSSFQVQNSTSTFFFLILFFMGELLSSFWGRNNGQGCCEPQWISLLERSELWGANIFKKDKCF